MSVINVKFIKVQKSTKANAAYIYTHDEDDGNDEVVAFSVIHKNILLMFNSKNNMIMSMANAFIKGYLDTFITPPKKTKTLRLHENIVHRLSSAESTLLLFILFADCQ